MLILGQKIIYVYSVIVLIFSGSICFRLYIFRGVLKNGKYIILSKGVDFWGVFRGKFFVNFFNREQGVRRVICCWGRWE